MPVSLAAVVDRASFPDLLFVVGAFALIVGVAYVEAARKRARSRRGHAEVSSTAQGSWDGVVDVHDVDRFIPGADIGTVKAMFLSEGVPVRIDVDAQGLRLRITSRLLKRYGDRAWSAPWAEVVGAEARPVGFKTLGGKISPVRLTDVVITVVGNSAKSFLESWDLVPDPDDPAVTAEDAADEEEWLAFVHRELGPSWRPNTAPLRFRTSAPDGLVDAIARWARGTLPDR